MEEVRQEGKIGILSHAARPGIVIEGAGHYYKVIKVLGAGGFGITYLVETENKLLVLKEHFLKGCWRGDDGLEVKHAPTIDEDVRTSRADFLEEARRLSILGSDTQYIVKVHDAFEANGTAYYSMEYLEGGNLKEYFDRHGVLAEGEAVNIIMLVAKAVGILHSSRILHLDIKPSNIMLKQGNDGKLKPVLIDFGIAKHFNSKGTPTTHLVAKGASSGYAPIEQYDDIERFAPGIDIYALGGTLYFMLTGKNPPKAFNINSFDDLRSNLPEGLSVNTIAAIEGAMRRTLSARTRSVDSFLSQLCGREIHSDATEVFLSNGVKKGLKKRWGIIGLFCSGILCLTILLNRSLTHTPPDTIENQSPEIISDSIDRASNKTEENIPDSHPSNITEDRDANETHAANSDVAEHADRPATDGQQANLDNRSLSSLAELKRLSDNGEVDATAKLARMFYDLGDFDSADKYARRAFYMGNRTEALSVIRDLETIDKYVNDPLPIEIAKALK